VPIDVDRARRQHAAYEAVLESLGWTIERLPALDEQPDAVFVEDAAIALDEVAVVAPMGASSRSGESRTVEEALARHLPVVRLTSPATLDGGDVMRAGRRLFVGQSRRTNLAAIEQLRRLLAPYDYEVIPVDVKGALHLKSACSIVGERTVLANTEWVDMSPFAGLDVLPVDASEAWGASVLHADGHVVMPTRFPSTARMLAEHDLVVHELDLTEIRKAEGGPTCLSILLPCIP
jgi:dimethylargininase